MLSFPDQQTLMTLPVKPLFLIILISPVLTFADTGDTAHRPPPSSILFEVGRDDANAEEYFTALNLGLGGGQRILFEAGETRLDNGEQSNIKLLRLGFGSDPLKDFSFVSSLQQRQLRDEFRIRSFNQSIALSLHDWLITATAGFRQISLFPVESERNRRFNTSNVYSEGWEIAVDYYGLPNWGLGVAHRRNRYDRKLSTFDDTNTSLNNRFSQHTLDIVWGLNDQRSLISATYLFPMAYASALYTLSESAVDESGYKTASLRLGWDITYDWTIEGEIGAGYSDNEPDDDIMFYGITLQRRW